MKRALMPRFSNYAEIRMGSPYQSCKLTLEGPWVPELPDRAWQDIWAYDPKGRFLAFIAWDIDQDNEPGFRVLVIDTKSKTTTESLRFAGCCNSIQWSSTGFRLDIFGFVRIGW